MSTSSSSSIWRNAGIDWRLASMSMVLAVMAAVFHVMSGGIFLKPENLYNIAQQTAVVGIVSTVMVLVIVARHIDLSVGSVMGFVGVLIAYLQYTSGWSWPASVLAGLAVALLVSVYQGGLTAVLGVPSFVVTLGGGYDGAIGTTASWVLGGVVCVGLLLRMLVKRRAKAQHEMPQQPMVVDLLMVAVPAVLLLLFVAAMTGYQIPNKADAQGIPVPVLIWAAVAGVLSFIVHRTRFGRYVYAMGGNPDAAALVGIPVKKVTLMLFALLGVLITVASVVSVARLNAGTNSLGTGMELYVIAAAVIGGTALAGGSGSILGSVLGALIMQSLDSGLLLLDVAIGKRMVIIGQVLIIAVVFDVLYRKYAGEN
jgi:D-xylose transport system permease protein